MRRNNFIIYTLTSFPLIWFTSVILNLNGFDITRIATTIYIDAIVIYLFIVKRNDYHINIAIKTLIIAAIILIFQAINPFNIIYKNSFSMSQQIFISTTYLLLILFYISVINIFKNQIKAYLIGILYASLIIELFIILLMLFSTLNHILALSFNNIRILNQIQIIIIPSLFMLLSHLRNLKYKLLTYIAIILNLLLVMFTGARGVTYALTIIYLFYFFKNKNIYTKRISIKIIITVVVSVILYMILKDTPFIQNGHLKHFDILFNSDGRGVIYKTEFAMLSKPYYFFNAIGFSPHNIFYFGHFHPHNFLLYLANGGGVFIFIVLLILLFLFVYHTYNKAHFSIVILLSYILYSMVSGTYINPLSTLYFIIFLAVFFNKTRKLKKINTGTIAILIGIVILLNVLTLCTNTKYAIIDNKQHKHIICGEGIFIMNRKLLKRSAN